MTAIICDNCGMENPDNVKFCKQCGNRLPVTAAPVAAAAVYTTPGSSTVSIAKRYPVLRFIAGIANVLGIIFAFLIFFAGYFLVRFVPDLFYGVLEQIVFQLLLGFQALIVYAGFRMIGENIMVQLDNEENTRRIVALLEQQMKN